ncbi:hypothetical protein O6H91_06G089600 [Diphasiastrum complanatum]|nr:hypothetical protein O6H91_06G089600 [Diphasiastrum complanatum]KAJ7553245.1 hypothetical protein O6H91_06G089600 [Diphasiastrum complanatum]KAJ7553246.1 hypothetical protein O6H91_06G089600 [Diphasiastrum complanatum]KAJ7553247.1 hypothetical protein O6H91_06G089600 [Diphasiastrum complanatum]
MKDLSFSPAENCDCMKEIEGHCDGDAMVHTKDRRKKKKKKNKGNLTNPMQIFAFSEEKQQKLDQEKAALPCTKDMVKKTLLKCATFPSPSKVHHLEIESMKIRGLKVQAIHNVELADELQNSLKGSTLEQSNLPATSCILRSALRGGHEEKGLGPRPKLQVKWAAEVYEPPITSISHTVGFRQQFRKTEHRRSQKSKSSKDKKSPEKIKTNLSVTSKEEHVFEEEALRSTEGKQQYRINLLDGISTSSPTAHTQASCFENITRQQVLAEDSVAREDTCEQEQVLGTAPDELNEESRLSEVNYFDTSVVKCSSKYGINCQRTPMMPANICTIQHFSLFKENISEKECSFDLMNESIQCHSVQTAASHQSIVCHLQS